MTLVSTQPVTRISKGMGKGGRLVVLTILPHSCVDCLEIREAQPSGTLMDVQGLLEIYLLPPEYIS
jgi:hypothetical protein